MTERDLDDIDSDELPDPELHELADALETESDADAGDDPGHDAVGHDVEPGHEHDHDEDDHADQGHDDHEEHPAEDPRWVVPPLAVGVLIGIVVLIVLGLASGASAFV